MASDRLPAAWPIRPQPDQVVEPLDDHADDAVASQCVRDFCGCGSLPCRSPRQKLGERVGQAGVDFAPTPCGASTVCRSGEIMHADEPDHQQRLAGNPDAELVCDCRS